MAKAILLGGTFCPFEEEIDYESGMYVELAEIRKDPLRKILDPANLTKCQAEAAFIPYGSSAYYQRQEKKPQRVLTGCATKKAEEKKNPVFLKNLVFLPPVKVTWKKGTAICRLPQEQE